MAKGFPPKVKHEARRSGGTPVGRMGDSLGAQDLANAHPDVPPSYPSPTL